MNAADFYERFKDALKAVQLPWGDMDQAQIEFENDRATVSANGLTYSFPTKEDPS